MAENIKWDSTISFLLAMIGSAVGLGNIWRYPYMAYTNGGGAFLLPYIISILIMGIPLLFIDYGIGFKFKAGITKIFKSINKKYEYLAWYIQLIPFFIVTYYSCIVAWDLIYIPTSFVKGWGSNPDNFFTNTILHNMGGFEGLFHISIYVLLALCCIWFICWFISHRNINSGLAKANKILIPALFIMMIIIVGYALTLPGAMIGVSSLLTPDWIAIINPDIWIAAFGQIFFSLNLGLTIVIAYASYLPDDVDIPKSALTVAFANCTFEVFTAFGIFAILGHMSQTSGVAIDQLITNGAGLAFVAFPQIFNVMGISGTIIGALFFICILFAGITSIISLIEPVGLSLIDKFGFGRKKVITILCISAFLISIIYSTSAGSTIIELFDGFLCNFGLLLNGLLEIIIIAWIYGLDNIIEGLNKNASFFKLGTKWKVMIKYIIPIILTFLWISGMTTVIKTSDTFSLIVQAVLIISLIALPIILTKLPSKSDNY